MWPYALLFLLFYIHVWLVFLRTETKKSLKRSLWSNFKSKKELLLVTELCSFIRKIASIFLDTYSLNIGLLPVLGLGLFQILFQMHSFFLIIKYCFSGRGWIEYFYFSAEFRLKIFLWIFLDYSIWHFCCKMYLLSGWC